eukprot:scaffold45423_cov60-Phaeocystis_antarctica.AAC.4
MPCRCARPMAAAQFPRPRRARPRRACTENRGSYSSSTPCHGNCDASFHDLRCQPSAAILACAVSLAWVAILTSAVPAYPALPL